MNCYLMSWPKKIKISSYDLGLSHAIPDHSIKCRAVGVEVNLLGQLYDGDVIVSGTAVVALVIGVLGHIHSHLLEISLSCCV